MSSRRTKSSLALSALILAATSLSLAEGCKPGESSREGPSAPSPGLGSTQPDLEAAKSALQTGALLVDVRSRSEFASGHARGAVNLPVDEVAERAPLLLKNKNASVVLVCASGHRASNAAKTLRGLGYTAVTNGGSHESFPQE